MKKYFAVLMALILVTAALPLTVHAAASASLTGPSVVRAGDTITLSFTAGGGIYGGTGNVSFDSSQLTLQSYSAKVGDPWIVEFSGNNFTFYDNSMATPINSSKTIFTATFLINSSVAAGTVISVSVQNVVLSDGNADSSLGTKTYSVTVAPPLSGNANLASLTVSNAYITPGFSYDNTSYSCSVPYSTDSLSISAVAEHPSAVISIANNYLVPDATTYVTVTVTAENGAVKKYYIAAYREQDPNYVPSDVNTLASLNVDGFRLSPAFAADQLQYAVYVPYEVDALALSAEVTDEKASVALPELTGIPVGITVYEIPVTAENGDVRTYTLTVVRADVFPPVETVPEETEPVTEPTEPVTEPTEPVTDPTTAPTTAPTEAPTQPAPAVEAPASGSPIPWILGILAAFAAGCTLTALLLKKKK